jgi:phosphoribosylaminoimidazolecarboxamide formyltransferase/IMP cyclohydrolase
MIELGNKSNHKIKTAIISVSDKTGLIEFARELATLGVTIYSTGGTKASLQNEGIPVSYISEITGFPEILDGRVKTLHPKIHAGLLADLGKENHLQQMQEHNLQSIDLLVVNLYPFEETLKKENTSHEDKIENIDIGGPAMLRASAKNYLWTAPVVNPKNYDVILKELKENEMTINDTLRLSLAAETFSHTSHYDSLISNYLNEQLDNKVPEKKTIGFNLVQSLRYGENPHQSAGLYGDFDNIFTKLHGKELSYNNILDIDAASKLIIEFDSHPTVAIIKHTNPCGVAYGNNLSEAYERAFATDTVSPFGGIISVNRQIDKEFAETVHSLFAELIIAPSYTEEAIEILKTKKDRRLITFNPSALSQSLKQEFRSVAGGVLFQETDKQLIDKEKINCVTLRQATDDEWQGLIFAWRVAKHVKSNAIVFASKDRTLGIGAGQMSRVDSSRIAVEKAKLMGLSLQGSYVASDAFFPFPDGVLEAANAGAVAIIQPGGSVRDADVIKAANDRDLAMIFTGLRHFKH